MRARGQMNVARRWVSITAALLLAVACHADNTGDVVAAAAGSGGQASGGAAVGGGGSANGGVSVGGASLGGGSAGAAAGGARASATLALSVGPFSTCAIGAEALVKCVGRCGSAGQGGSRDKAPAGLHAVAVAVGRDFACAVLKAPGAGGVVQCWGAGLAATPPMLSDAVELTAGDQHACALGSQGTVTCWGDAAHAAPDAMLGKHVAASGAMTCVITSDDSVRCWGPHPATPPPDLRASQLALSSQLTDAAQGPRFGCAVTLTGDVRCFGDDVGHVQTPPNGLKAKRVAVGRNNACAIGLDDSVTCWGAPLRYGAVLPAGLKASALSLAFRSAGAVTLDQKFVLWGDTSDGRSTL